MKLVTIGATGLAVGLIGCGGGDDNKTVTPKPGARGATTVRVTETEFKLNPADPTIKKSGRVTFEVVNKGKVAHSLEVEGKGIEKRIPGTIAPGASKKLTLTLKPGKYEWYCPVDGHKGLGMKGDITVGSAGGGSSGGQGGGGGGGY
jgi:plastocyanin